MKTLFKKLVLLSLFIGFGSSFLNAQVAVLQFRSVPDEHVEEFVKRETTYWSKIAKKAVDDGKLVNWELWRTVGGFNVNGEGSHNFVFLNVFKDKAAMDDMAGMWNAAEVFPDVDMKDMETWSLGTVVHNIMISGQGGVGRRGNFARVNFSKASNWQKYRELELEVWQPFITKAMEEKKTSCVGWNLSGVVMPGGTDTPFNVFTVDYFDKMSEAMMPTWADDLEFPDLEPYADSFERKSIRMYRLVGSIN